MFFSLIPLNYSLMTRIKPSRLCFWLLLFFLIGTAHLPAQSFQPNWPSLDARPVPDWFVDAKFGIFVHWGVYSVPAWGPTDSAHVYAKYAEWYWKRIIDPEERAHEEFAAYHAEHYGPSVTYPDFAPEFTAEHYDPAFWADVFADAGARYVVMVSKHHDGYAMWPSQYSWNWNAGEVGPQRDLAGDLVDAVRAKGIRMGFYYSLYEWFNPLYLRDVDAYVDQHMLPQMKELVNRYEPDIIWPDGEWVASDTTWRSTEFLSWLYNDSPVKDEVVVNDRWGAGGRSRHGGYYTTEYGLVESEDGLQAEQYHPWEECRGIGGSFGYNRAENLEHYSSSAELIHILARTVARGGNLLLNIGPTADGRIPVIMQQRLADIGTWLSLNGEAIYGTRPWFDQLDQMGEEVLYTTKGDDLYVICLNWPSEGISLPLSQAPQAVSLLGYEGALSSRHKKGTLRIEAPQLAPGTLAAQSAWVFRVKR
jgi:alpha-L-fucosidase